MRAFFMLGISLLLLSCNQLAAQVKFYITAPKSVPVNQNFQLDIVIENGNTTSITPPALPDFQALAGPNQSTTMQGGSNGWTKQIITISYILKPKKEGTFKIGKASVIVSGVKMESNELSIDVTKAAAQQAQRQRDPIKEEPITSAEDLAKQIKDDIFIRLITSKSSVYNGEMLTATYKLYFLKNLSPPRASKAPLFDGFWSQQVEYDPEEKQTVETVNGRQYNAVALEKYHLYPQRTGTLLVPAEEFSTVAEVPVKTIARDFFGSPYYAYIPRQVPLNLKTNAENVFVKELPKEGQPTGFTGAVGKFNFETSISSKEGKTDDPITYSVKISGTGNLKLIEAPGLKLPPAFEVYDPKLKENITNGSAGLNGTKQYDYLIIPRQPGEYKIDKREFSYFDPSVGKYFTISTSEYNLKISGEASKNPNANVSAISKQDVVAGQDIRYIKTATPLFSKTNSFFGSTGYFALYTTPALLFIGLIAFKRKNESLAADVIGTKRRRAIKLAKKRLSIADKYLKSNDKKPFYDEVSRAIWGYLGDKLNIDMADLSKDNVDGKLVGKSVKPETISSLTNLISTCEIALYTPIGENGEMKKNYETALNLIADLEDEIK